MLTAPLARLIGREYSGIKKGIRSGFKQHGRMHSIMALEPDSSCARSTGQADGEDREYPALRIGKAMPKTFTIQRELRDCGEGG